MSSASHVAGAPALVRDGASAVGRVGRWVAHHPRGLWVVPKRIVTLSQMLLRHPRQFRYVARWMRSIERTTMDLKVPWLPFEVIDRLEERVTSATKVFEYGGGGSTVWFASRVGEIVTVEHDASWAEALREQLADEPRSTIVELPPAEGYAQYVASIDQFADGYFDIVVVDGRERVRSLEHAMSKVRAGGWLILDDSQRERYARAFELLDGKPFVTVRGLAPGKVVAACTTIWTL